jgi:peptide-methionine (S)-S-oxide reductase
MARMTTLPTPTETLSGRSTPVPVPERHFVNGNRMMPPFPAGLECGLFGMGCFWGAERLFWEQPGVYSTAAGYAGPKRLQ